MYKLCKSDGYYKTGDIVKLRKITVDCAAEFYLTVYKKNAKNGPFYTYTGKVVKPDSITGYKLNELYGLPVNSFYKS